MRSKKRTIGILIVVIVVLLGFAGSLLIYRNKLSSEKTKNNSNNNTAKALSSAPSGKSIENFYDKPITDEKIALDSIEVNRDKLGYSDENFTFIYDEKSGSKTAYHFDLYYKDIPVYSPVGIRGVSVITYYDNSADVLITGVSDSEKIVKINTIPKITQDEALDIAKETLGEKFSEYNIGVGFKQVKVSPKLTIYECNDKYELAYYVRTGSYLCVINAENGEIIECHSVLVSNSAEYEGQNGDIHQIFYDDYKDEENDIKDMLWNKDKNIVISDYPIRFMSLSDIQYGKNKSAVDAMANTYRAVEYFDSEFGVSFDNTMCIINVNGDCINNAKGIGTDDEEGSLAFIYIGERTNKEKAQYSAYLDIVAHEYTHAVTDIKAFGSGYKSDRRYFERNSLMEAYSDIFGELVEREYTGNNDWKHNNRNIKNPQIEKYSERYQTNDSEGNDNNDYGGAHWNSTIISHAAYLMSKDHKSIKHSSYGSTKNLLDYNQLAQLWYGSLIYLKDMHFQDFSDCRYAVEKSARKLIKEGVLLEDNLKVIEQAFNEVEVSSNPARRGAKDSAEIKENHTLVVPIEDETQSSEFVEITDLNYTWHLSPTIEAEDIIVPDNKDIELEEGYVSPYDECALIKQDGKYGIIQYDGTNIAEPIYKFGSYDILGAIGVYNEYDQTKGAERVDVFSDKEELRIQINQERGWGYVGITYYWDNHKQRIYQYEGSPVYDVDNLSYNVVVQSADIEENGKVSNISEKYGIANQNKLLVPIEYDKGYMHSFNNIIALEKENKWTYFDKDGKVIIKNCDGFTSNNRVIDWWTGGDWYNHNNDYILPYLPTENYIPLKINGQCGYYDTQGNEVIPCGTFEEVRPVHNGFAWVKKDGKWGVIKLKNIEIETNTKPTNLTVNVDSTYIGEITKDNCTHNYMMSINEGSSLFTVQYTNSNGLKGGFDIPIDKLENGVYFYTNGSSYDRNQITGGRINAFKNLTGTITVNNDGSLMWKTEDSLPYELILTAYSTMANQEANTNNFNINNYEGTYHTVNSDFNLQMEIKIQSESSVDVKITFTNDTGTRVSENSFSGNIESNTFTFETDDGYGRNSFTLDFKEDKIYLLGKCIDCYSSIWGLPEMNQIKMQIN